MDIAVTHVYDLVVLTITGEIGLVTAPQLAESIDTVVTEHAPAAIVVDLSAVTFLASVGMMVLAQAGERIGQSTRFAVVADGYPTGRPLELMGLDHAFAVYSDVDAAVTALTS